jgi:uncharacterized membrane protein
LMAGRTQYLAVNQSTLLFSRPPFFEALLALVVRLFGYDVRTLRALTGCLGLLSVGALYAVARRISGDRRLALLAALLLAIYPPAVLYSRFGFSYNLLTPLVLTTLAGAYRYGSCGDRCGLGLAALSIGLGTLGDLWMFVLVVPLGVVVVFRHWRDLIWSVPLALVPFGSYAAVMLLTVPRAFLFDANFVLSRLNQLPLSQQATTLAQNFMTLAAQDNWFVPGLIGLWWLRPAAARGLSLIFFLLPFALLGRTTALFSLSFYYLIPLLPFMALGMAGLIRYGVPGVVKLVTHNRRTFTSLVVSASLMAAMLVTLSTTRLIGQIHAHWTTDIDSFLIEPDAARAAASFVNTHTREGDLVIASPAVAWLLNANVADFQMSIAVTARATPHLPADLPSDRWAFDPAYQRARFIVVDNLWRNWAAPNVPGVAEMLKQVEAWSLVFKSGEVAVYQRPE